MSNVCAHTASHERGLFKWLSAYAAAASAAIKGELRENGVGGIEARIMGKRERITLKGKAYFKKVREQSDDDDAFFRMGGNWQAEQSEL